LFKFFYWTSSQVRFDLFCILPRVPDYCASLRSRILPVTLHWFPVQEILSISAMDLESKYCYFYHSKNFKISKFLKFFRNIINDKYKREMIFIMIIIIYCNSKRFCHWFPVQEILSISAMDLESKYCYFYHSWDFVP
jgi:hypothetical protein